MKKIYIFLFTLLICGIGFAQSTINITTSGGSYGTEKWVSITTGIDGSGTQVWGQGDGSYGNGQGLINEDISIAPGTYYVNCYDRYSDGWDGTLISVTAYGNVIGDNGGASPDDPLTVDSTSSWETPADELEASFEIIVPAPPTCGDPTDLAATATGTTSADLSWTAPTVGTPTGYNWEVQPTGTAQGNTGAPASGTSASITASATGLMSGTTYDLYVQTDCGGSDTSEWVGPVSFTTDCSVFTVPYTEDFDSTATGSSSSPNVPNCWSFIDEGTGYGYVSSYGANSFYMYNSLDSTGNYILVSPSTTDLSSGLNRVSFDVDGSSGQVLSVGTMSDETDPSTFTEIQAVTLATSDYESYTINIPVGSDMHLAFKHGQTGTYDSYYLDNILIEPIPSCVEPSDLAATATGATTADLSWTAPSTGTPTGYNWEVQPTGTAQGTAGAPASGTSASTTASATGLTAETTYDLYVQTDCGGSGTSSWAGPISFTTPCATIVPEYNADMSTNAPDSCWEEAGSGDPGTGPSGIGFSDWRSGTSYAIGSSNAVNIYGTSIREWLLSPSFDMSADDYQLEINVAVTDWQSSSTDDSMGADDEVQLLISTDGGTTWTNLTTWNASNEPLPSGTEYVEDLTAYTGTVQFAIWANSGTASGQDYDFHVGKFRVAAIPSSATVDYCNLQFPNSGSINEGDNFTAYAEIYQAGVTEAIGQGANIESWIGYSTTDATALADFETASWTWVPATYNSDSGNNDEYQAEIGSALSGGNYYYASRFRYDGGVFAYGGITPGSSGGNFWDGTNFVSGQLDVLPPPPTTSATLNISGCNASDSFNVAYASATDNVVWVELIYDGNCSEITVDTETSSGIDTEIALYDVFGNVLGSDDDGGTGSLSSLTLQGLSAGTYYVVAGAFNTTFASNFNASTSDTADAGTLYINASTPNIPDYVNLQFPGTATITAGGTADVYAQIYEDSNTAGAGAGTNITAEIGISAVDATEVADFETGDWTWTTAPYFGESGNNDEYALAIGASLAPGTYYYVSRFSVDGGPYVYGGNDISDGDGGDFWNGSSFVSGVLTVNAKPEPTNHVLTFAAVADSDTEITLTWDDNDGAQQADGFLIVAKTGAATFYVPVDGTDDTTDTNWSDDEAEVKVASGVQTYTFTSLTASTLYEFEIYPYTNFGTNIDYKTDGTVPSASATTDADPCVSILPDYLEDFASYIPDCWEEGEDGDLTAGPATTGSGGWLAEEFAHTSTSGGGAANINLWQSGDVNWLLTPSFDLSADGYQIRVDAALTDFGSTALTDALSAGDVISLVYSNDGTNWTTLYDFAANIPAASGEMVVVDLTGITGTTVQFAFYTSEGASGRDIDFHIDNFRVEAIPVPMTYTYNGAWSPSDPNGVASYVDDITVVSGNAIISSNTECNNVVVNPGASMTVNSGVTLALTNSMTLESASNDYSNLMLDGTVSGTVIYERYTNANSNGNDLISPPLGGQTWADFLADGSNAADLLDDGNTSPTTYLFGPFDKTTDDWLLYTDATVATLNSGTGYRAGTDAGTTLSFTGSVETSMVTVNIEDTGANFPDWNLIGNPYTTYLDMTLFLNYDLGDGTTNIDLLEDVSGIYGYDGSASNGWDVITLANASAKDMTPGQGFFVAANDAFVAGYDITFDPSMRVAGSGDDFIVGRNSSDLTYLKLNTGTATKDFTTQFYFNDNATAGLDHGYDAQIWGGTIPSFALYSNLVQDNTGMPIALQALNTTDLANTVIPLGVNANAGEQLTFTISETTLPSTVNVYLDDTLNNTTTLLNTSDYVINPISDITGTGRFYIRFAQQSLSTTDVDFDNLKIYTKTTPRALYVHGVLQGETTAKVYDLQGRLVHHSVLNSNNLVNQIDASDFSDGVYVVTLSNGVQEKSQKVIIR
ncbi:fibronectin type III domain-containing protein [Winogradskyella sp. MH6]|uniref:fibronectin type III domain-containing protein n=1 Tax=Winogradskyella sp. MH6 TaxID=2929510 RepID=UPI001FB1F650|nr:fibronectin type III domain-containing protein [Winogradskyella sp. MH6]